MTDPKDKKPDKRKLIHIIGQHTQNTTATYERAKAELLLLCVEDFIESIDTNSKESHSLATKVFWLNVVLTVATAIGVVFGILTFFCR